MQPSDAYSKSLLLIVTGGILLAFLYWKKYNSIPDEKRGRVPLPFQSSFRFWFFGYAFLIMGIIMLVMKITGQL